MVNPTGARLTSVAQSLLATAVPLSGVYLADLAMEATDTAMVGHLGARAIAAVGLGGAIMLIYSAFTMSMPSCAGTSLGGLGLIWGDVIGLTAAALFCAQRVRTLLRRLPV